MHPGFVQVGLCARRAWSESASGLSFATELSSEVCLGSMDLGLSIWTLCKNVMFGCWLVGFLLLLNKALKWGQEAWMRTGHDADPCGSLASLHS